VVGVNWWRWWGFGDERGEGNSGERRPVLDWKKKKSDGVPAGRAMAMQMSPTF
jgi:hypothetical protein